MKKNSLLLAVLSASASCGWAADAIDDLSLEDLLKAEVTSVSRKSQSLADVPAAAFVISADDIRRSGVQALPDVLRMAPGIEVARIDSGRYAVSARGSNGRFANKLQVLIDGRSIYYPIFTGVIWENDFVPLEDIERVEVLRGPGAAMWGVNAVNGVINIITKHSRNQAGSAIVATAGSDRSGSLYVRQGGVIGDDTSWKISAQGRHTEPSTLNDSGAHGEDRLNDVVVDIRLDKEIGAGRDLTLWANASNSSLPDLWRAYPEFSPTTGRFLGLSPITINQSFRSASLMGRYRWVSDGGIESSLQMGVTGSGFDVSYFLREDRTTYDLDYQARYSVGSHDLLWGGSHRTSSDTVFTEGVFVSWNTGAYTQHTSGLFLHDDWTLIPERLTLGAGARWDNTNLGGDTYSTNASLMWTPSRSDTVWLKYAKAPRMPARAENNIDIFISAIPPSSQTFGMPVFIHSTHPDSPLKPEQLEGVELGYRKQVTASFNVDASAYRYRYTNLRSAAAVGYPQLGYTYPQLSAFNLPFLVQTAQVCSCLSGWTTGAELSADWLVVPSWRLQASYTWIKTDMDAQSDPSLNFDAETTEKSGPRHYASLRSQWNISSSQQFDVWVRGSAGYYRLNAPYDDMVRVPGYATLDLRYGYRFNKDVEVSLAGRNLVGPRRMEYVSDYLPSVPVEVRPTAAMTVHWKF